MGTKTMAGGVWSSARVASTVVILMLTAAACTPFREVARIAPAGGSPVEVEAGTALRVVSTFGFGDFGLAPGDLDPLPFPEIVFVPRENVTGSFFLRSAMAPGGWTVSLAEVERVVEDIGEGGRAFRLEVSLRIEVPVDAALGPQRVAAIVRARNGVERVIRTTVQVM